MSTPTESKCPFNHAAGGGTGGGTGGGDGGTGGSDPIKSGTDAVKETVETVDEGVGTVTSNLISGLLGPLTKAEALEPESAEMPEMDLSLFEGAAAATVAVRCTGTFALTSASSVALGV